MNIIFIRAGWGQNSTEKIAQKMQSEVLVLAERKNGTFKALVKTNSDASMWNWCKLFKQDGNDLLDAEDSQLINWGTAMYGSIYKLNDASSVARAAHKSLARKMLGNAGVRIPRTFFHNQNWETSSTIIARPPHHHGGQDFYILNDTEDFIALAKQHNIQDWYFSEIFPKTHEFRYHVAHGKILFVQEKPLKEGEIRGNYAVNEDAWRVLPWKEFHTGMAVESVKAVEVLGLDFGAVDMLYNSTNNTWAVCEVNTAPSSASEYASGKYAAYFDWCIRHNFPEHFDLQEDSTNVFYSKLLRE